MEIDLQPFCDTAEIRYYLMKPFSRGGFTWATNGHILVRVPLREGVAPIEKDLAVEKIMKVHDGASFAPLPKVKFRDAPVGECELCGGRGKEHDCPDCECKCEACDGTGKEVGRGSVGVRGAIFDVKYIRMILALPGAEMAVGPLVVDAPAPFRFDGGCGVVMPMWIASNFHLGDIESLPAEGA